MLCQKYLSDSNKNLQSKLIYCQLTFFPCSAGRGIASFRLLAEQEKHILKTLVTKLSVVSYFQCIREKNMRRKFPS